MLFVFETLIISQLSPVVELLGNSSLDIVRGRHVLRTLFSKRKNLTGDDIARWEQDAALLHFHTRLDCWMLILYTPCINL